MKNLLTMLMILAMMLVAGSALAGAKIDINDNASLNLGYRVQVLGANTKTMDYNGDGKWDSVTEWKLRRGRLRLGAAVGEHMTAFLQTDVSGGGKPVEMIDAWINFKHNNWLQFIVGRNMAPASRQNLTSSGALMAMDRPGMAYKSLTWGARARAGFTNLSYAHSNEFTDYIGDANTSSFVGSTANPQAVRDMGLTVFGTGDMGENGHLKYYAAVNNGIQVYDNTATLPANSTWDNNKERFTFRAQYNLWDAEGGFYNSSTYLGKKKTLGIGASYDMQSSVAQFVETVNGTDRVAAVDYKYFEIDGFLDYPMGDKGNALTVEAAFMNLDFGNYAKQTAGNGIYGQIGYYIAREKTGWQPWFAFETWSADAAEYTAAGGANPANQPGEVGTTPGNYTNMRFGVTYYLEGQAANIKAGYEMFKSDTPLAFDANGNSAEDSYGTFVLGFFTTY